MQHPRAGITNNIVKLKSLRALRPDPKGKTRMSLLTAQRAPAQGRPTPHRHKRLHRNLIQKSLHLAVTKAENKYYGKPVSSHLLFYSFFSKKGKLVRRDRQWLTGGHSGESALRRALRAIWRDCPHNHATMSKGDVTGSSTHYAALRSTMQPPEPKEGEGACTYYSDGSHY